MRYWEDFKNNNPGTWHFDPKAASTDYQYVTRLPFAFDDLIELSRRDEMFRTLVLTDLPEPAPHEITERVEALRRWGYTRHTSVTRQVHDEQCPSVFAPYLAASKLKNPVAHLIKALPGELLPWHYDTFVGYMKKHGLSDDRSIVRYVVFPQDWTWGHYFFAGNSVIHQWVKGDVFRLPHRMHHAACNVGMEPKLTLVITGEDAPDALHGQP